MILALTIAAGAVVAALIALAVWVATREPGRHESVSYWQWPCWLLDLAWRMKATPHFPGDEDNAAVRDAPVLHADESIALGAVAAELAAQHAKDWRP
jgi:hypothetical protein